VFVRCVCRLLVCTALVAVASPAHAATGAEQTALDVAAHTQAAKAVGAGAQPRPFQVDPRQWQVRWFRGSKPVLEVDVDVQRRAVLAVWRGAAIDYPMARGYRGWFGGQVSAVWIWLPLCLAFIAPFVDPRRPFRRLHLDLLAILSLSVSLAFFDHGSTAWSVPLVYPPLLYLLWTALRLLSGSERDEGTLVPLVSRRVLVVGLVLLVALRATLNLADTGTRTYVGFGSLGSHVVDVGYAGVVGADRIEHGQPLYSAGGGHLDTYGALNYLAYVPFELIWPYHGVWDELPAAHAAALAFDLAVVLLLLLLGRRLRPGGAGRDLGVALAYGWAACPWTAYVLASNTNDGLVAATLAAALLAWSVPWLRGALIGAGTVVKFAPAAVLPLAMTGGRRAALLALVAFAVVVVGVTLPFIPDGGLRELYDTTIGYQLGARSPFSIWGRWSGIEWLHTLAKAGAVSVALGSALTVARRRGGSRDVAAGMAAALIALELTAMHWIYFYVVWFLPAFLVAVFVTAMPAREREPRAEAAFVDSAA
jgi:Glycosyltransferase family 87